MYYGKYNSTPVKYRVLDKKATEFTDADNPTMLLDCDSTLLTHRFDDDSNVWAESEIKGWLNGNDFLNNDNVFTPAERAAIASSTKASAVTNDGNGWSLLDYAPLEREKIFLLDAKEATRPSYGYANTYDSDGNRSKTGAFTWWWLRSPIRDIGSRAGNVATSGGIGSTLVDDVDCCVSPAFNIKLSSVIFSSVITGTEYKLTIKDSSLKVTVDEPLENVHSGNKVTVAYSGVQGSPAQLSVLITDKAWDKSGAAVKYYGKLNIEGGAIGTSGTGSFTVPDGFESSYRIYIVPEIVNGVKETDYAGTPTEIGKKTHDSKKKKEKEQTPQTPASWILNPDEKQQLSIVYTGSPEGTCAGYQEQGALAKAAFDKATPKGWTEAFEFNLLNKDRKPEMTLKKGMFTLTIPSEYQKAGRQFAIIALTKGGQTILLPDTDADPTTITVSVNHEGYAFRLIFRAML